MKTLCFYVENADTTFDTLEYIMEAFPCFVKWTSVEMNYLEISVMARDEDIAAIEKLVAELV